MLCLLLVFLAATAAWVPPPSLNPNNRIIGGEGVDIVYFPYQVSLQLKSSSGSLHICGGSIYNHRTIVTAAHCVNGFTANQLVIKAGITELSESSPALAISSLIPSENYDAWNQDYDVAVIILANPLTFSNKIQPIELATTNPNTDVDVVVTGWGSQSEGGSASPYLQQVIVPIVSEQVCKVAYGSSSITPQMICAGVEWGGKDACRGDSGGPMALNNTLVGIVSFGYGCARPGYPGVYTSVATVRSWIVRKAVV